MGIDYTRRPSGQDPAAPAAGGVSLTKISLTKSAPTVNLTKSGQQQGAVRVNLNWSQGKPSGFLAKLSGRSGNVDLDLGCLYELSNGKKGVVQALGNSFGSLQGAPHIQLDGDDRTGTATGGENMHIDLSQPGAFRRILIFAMIYEGAPNWAAVDGVVTVYPTTGPQIEVRLDSPNNSARICAIALLQNTGSGIDITREVKYIDGSQSDLDRAYNWGLRWAPGSK